MKSHLSKTSLTLAVIIGFTLAMPNLFAVQIVDFTNWAGNGNDIVSSSTNLNLTTPTMTSGVFDTDPASEIAYVGAADRIFAGSSELLINASPAGFLWQKEDFLNGGDAASQSVDLDATSNFNIGVGDRGGNSNTVDLKWLIYQDSQLYVSSETIRLAEDTAYDSGDFTSMTWAPIDLDDDINDSPGTFGSPGLDDIEGVGFYLFDDSANGRIAIETFTADATVIPEPTASALLLLAAGGLLMFRQRRR